MTVTTDVIKRLDDLERKVAEASERRESVRRDRARALGQVSAAEAEFARYQEAIGAGEQAPDADRERGLTEAIEAARRAASEDVWSARQVGAERAVEAAESARDAFGRERFPEIAVAEALRDGPARDRLQAAWEELQEAESEYATRVRRWHHVAPFGGLDVDDLPGLPTRGDPGEVVSRFAAGIDAPTPRSLVTEAGP
jgi:hypothetical protein